MAKTTDDTKEMDHPPLEDFTVTMPSIRFFNYSKLSQSSNALRKLKDEIKNFEPKLAPKRFLLGKKHGSREGDFDNEEEEEAEVGVFDEIDTSILEKVPPLAASSCDYDLKPDKEFLDLIKKQYDDRFKMADEFRKEESRVMSNYYFAQLREHMQKNESLDHRPVSDALRYISKVHAFPMDLGGQRFYKFNVRNEKMQKKHKKALDRLSQSQDLRAEWLLQHQIHEVLTYGDINKTPVENVKIPKLPIPSGE